MSMLTVTCDVATGPSVGLPSTTRMLHGSAAAWLQRPIGNVFVSPIATLYPFVFSAPPPMLERSTVMSSMASGVTPKYVPVTAGTHGLLNDASKSFNNPCVPAVTGTYFGVTPLAMDDITVDLSSIGGGAEKTKGYKVAIGETKTFPIGLWSQAAADPWSMRVVEGNPTLGPVATSHVTVSMDIKSGQNGQKAYVTVTVKSAGDYGTELISVESFR